MQVLSSTSRTETSVVLLFGAGLIGSQIFRQLVSTHGYQSRYIPYPWAGPGFRIRANQNITQALTDIRDRRTGPRVSLTVMWSAGKAGFEATEEAARSEIEVFKLILTECDGWKRLFDHCSFFLVSSAGGLFEGRRYVDVNTMPCVNRVYGVLKQEQERLVAARSGYARKRVFRLSSVYGYIVPNHRVGLIQNLVEKTLLGQPVHVTGRISTLRDFIWAGDVGAYLAGCIQQADRFEETDQPPRVEVLASGKPTTIGEVKNIVERLTGLRTYCYFDTTSINSADITYSSRLLPENWRSIPLVEGVGKIYRHWIQHQNLLY